MSVSEQDVKKGLINDQLEQQLQSVGAQVEANLERGRNAWAEWQATISDSASRLTRDANNVVHQRPWEMVVAAALAGLVVGLICSRR